MEFSSSSHLVVDYTFAFDNAKFSDRTLKLEIIPDSTVVKPDPIHNVRDWALTCSTKRRRFDHHHHSNYVTEVVKSNENLSSAEFPEKRVKTIHISTIVLAAKSPFFYKLFSNGMSESNEQHVAIQIQESEEDVFMDLLKFMYTNTLSSTTPSALLDVLIIADKYEVASCMNYCFHLLSKLPITCESALLYLDLPSTSLLADTVWPLTDAAKRYLVARFKDISLFEEEMLTLPLVGIEAVLLSDELHVFSEDSVYDFVMKWVRKHYATSDERQEMLTTRLLHLIRFPFMSCAKLKEVLNCRDVNLEVVSKLVFDALSFKIPHQQPRHAPLERAYKYRPVKVSRFDSPREICKVYLNLTHEECVRLLPDDEIHSERFDLGGKRFWLMGSRDIDGHSQLHSFGFYLCMLGDGPFGVEYEFSCRMKPWEKFVVKREVHYDFTDKYAYGLNLFEGSWEKFIAANSPYFINGVLHLRAVIKIKRQVSDSSRDAQRVN